MTKGKPKLLVIVGPTAVGKTKFALELAKYFSQIEVISADSRQIYKLMDIGTAKPTPAERQQVVHHFIDICYPDEPYSAGTFGQQGRESPILKLNSVCDIRRMWKGWRHFTGNYSR